MPSLINQNWVFGQRARLSFSTPVPTASAGSAISTGEGCASISDANGNLLAYTDGMTVWDAGGTQRASSLQGNSSSTQSAIIVPDPSGAGRYYVFTADGWTGGNKHVDGVRIDTSVSTWPVTQLSSIMTLPPTAGYSSTEKLTAVQHANCRDFWVLTVIQQTSNKPITGPGWLRVFLVSPAGVQHVGDAYTGVSISDVGYLKASGDGRRIAIANYSDHNVMVCPFDNATGVADFSQLVTFNVPTLVANHPRSPYGIEFSPQGRFLYYSVLGGIGTNPTDQGYVFQQDLANPSSAPVLAAPPHPNLTSPTLQANTYALGALQLGMDNRIYIAQDGEQALGVIAAPDQPGTACSLTFGAVPLASGSLCRMGLPNLIPNPCPCPCVEGHCDAALDRANSILNAKADQKSFTVPALGQTPPSKTCALAFEQHDFSPLFTLHWGDGPTDQFESDDTEVIYIRVRNPYRNLVYRGLRIFNIRVTPNQVLPDGDAALRLVPAEIVCFDQVEPCSYVSRDFVFLIVHAQVNGYQITFDYCIEEIAIVGSGDGHVAFPVDVVAS